MAETSPDLPLLIAAGALIIGLTFFSVGRSLRRDERDLSKGLVTIRATIIRKYRKAGAGTWGRLENYFIMTRYADAAGDQREAELRVASRAWRMLREEGGVSLNYPSSQPSEVRFGSALAYRLRRGLGMLLMVGGIGEALFFVVGCLLEFTRVIR